MTDEEKSKAEGEPRELSLQQQREADYESARANLQLVRKKDSSEREANELHEAQFQAQVAWLRLNWGEGADAPTCPYCSNRHWEVEDPVQMALSGSERPMPFFPVICSKCGTVTLVSTIYARLEEGEEESSNE